MPANYSAELEYYDRLHAQKCRDNNQTFENHAYTTAENLATNYDHMYRLYDILQERHFLPAGRIQAALGAKEREVSPFNCAVSQVIEDSMSSIMEGASKAAMILRLGTGIGFNFSHLRPQGALIVKTQTQASGPVSFMEIYDVTGKTIASSGHRRGAMMGILNVDHPDIEAFIDAKMVQGRLRQFNISVGVTDDFMGAVHADGDWDLVFGGQVYRTVRARSLWNKIISNAYNSAEPGVVFLTRMNEMNNLYYCETIEATNPCAEQPLPPKGLCMLGSINLIKYIDKPEDELYKAVTDIVEGYDNIFNKAVYAVPEHRTEAVAKRRMGLGFTGIANAIEMKIGRPSYGSEEFCDILNHWSGLLTKFAYRASAKLASARGSFQLFDKDKYLESKFIKTLDDTTRDMISQWGIRNSHLISYAPCGTISQYAGNTSSGVEPIFYHRVSRKVFMKEGLIDIELMDYNVREHGFYGRTLNDCSVEDHLRVAETIQAHTDSAVSKTVNVAQSCTYDEYETIYQEAYNRGLKGITVFRPNEVMGAGVITEAKTSSCKDGVCAL